MNLCNEKDCKYYDKKYECSCSLGDSTETFETCQNNNLRFKSPQNLAKPNAYSLLGEVTALLKEAVETDGGHRKQWFLEQIALKLNIDLPEHEKGIAP